MKKLDNLMGFEKFNEKTDYVLSDWEPDKHSGHNVFQSNKGIEFADTIEGKRKFIKNHIDETSDNAVIQIFNLMVHNLKRGNVKSRDEILRDKPGEGY